MEYEKLVEKLAREIVDEAIMEKEAGATETVEKGKEAIIAAAEKAKDKVPDKAKDAVERVKALMAQHKAAAAGAVGAGAGAGAGYEVGKKAEEDNTELEKTAEEQVVAILDKAADVFENAQLMKQAALEVMAEAEMHEEAAMQVFNQMGIDEE